VDQQKALLEVESQWFAGQAKGRNPGSFGYPLEAGMRELARLGVGNWFWACDRCIDAGRARRADITKQNLGLGTPFAAYIDRPFTCQDCRQPSVFGAAEQKHWFEELGFLIWVHPTQCPACRRKRRAKKRLNAELAAALAGLDPGDARQLDAIAGIYEAMGNVPKAGLFRARARNVRGRST
jgi:hypothetical protein